MLTTFVANRYILPNTISTRRRQSIYNNPKIIKSKNRKKAQRKRAKKLADHTKFLQWALILLVVKIPPSGS